MAVQICAGELPPDAGQLEARLSLIFQIAQHWGAILLLDEADVYLEQRSSCDLGRNSLVSVFLRKMEFCEAIVFLITNRVTQFDEAILSGVHLAMKYGDLDRGRRKLIWKNFLDRANNPHGKADISDKELDQLVRIELNGRQIKNVVATACALAAKTSRVRFVHLETAIKAGKKFVDDFYGTNHKAMY
ncbi:hypothetical protein DL769_005640 [Monosporascus sp. CRB-8-3]|nr:hypothetical protein DL769_005640 [Monosporascus sp. CRB-8-3]